MSNLAWAIFSFCLTAGVYFISKKIYQRFRRMWCAPIVLTPIVVLLVVAVLAIPLPDYFEYSHWLTWMLGPATIAFALPIYRQRQLIARYPLTTLAGVVTAVVTGLLVNWGFGRLVDMPHALAMSMLPRSVTTPFAMQTAHQLGGMPDVTAVLVLVTGIIGMVICVPLFKLLRARSAHSRGAGLGGASHGAGTARAIELGAEEGAIASVTMVFAGIVMVLIAPLLAHLLG